jgi:hypothetical protein
MTGEEYKAALNVLGLSQEAAGVWLGLSPRTGQNYAILGPPKHIAHLIRVMLKYKISVEDVEKLRR